MAAIVYRFVRLYNQLLFRQLLHAIRLEAHVCLFK